MNFLRIVDFTVCLSIASLPPSPIQYICGFRAGVRGCQPFLRWTILTKKFKKVIFGHLRAATSLSGPNGGQK